MKFNATSRSVQGSSASRRLRRAGRVPAIVYGGEAQFFFLLFVDNVFLHALRKEAFHASILDMDLEGKTQPVLLRAVQWHPYKQQVLHVDFQRVSASQRIHTKVPVHFINGENSPAVKIGGAIISHVATELDVSCLPADLPAAIEVDLGNLEAGASVHLADITLPKGVTAVVHGDENPVLALAMVTAASKADDADDAAEEGASAE